MLLAGRRSTKAELHEEAVPIAPSPPKRKASSLRKRVCSIQVVLCIWAFAIREAKASIPLLYL